MCVTIKARPTLLLPIFQSVAVLADSEASRPLQQHSGPCGSVVASDRHAKRFLLMTVSLQKIAIKWRGNGLQSSDSMRGGMRPAGAWSLCARRPPAYSSGYPLLLHVSLCRMGGVCWGISERAAAISNGLPVSRPTEPKWGPNHLPEKREPLLSANICVTDVPIHKAFCDLAWNERIFPWTAKKKKQREAVFHSPMERLLIGASATQVLSSGLYWRGAG